MESGKDNSFLSNHCHCHWVECSLAGHQFLLFRATLFKIVIEEKLLNTSSYTINHYFCLLVIIHIYR